MGQSCSQGRLTVHSEIEWGSLMAWRGISERLTVAEGDVLSILHKAVESRLATYLLLVARSNS